MAFAIIQKLGLDTKDFERGLQRGEQRARGFGGTMSSIFRRFGALISTAAVAAVTKRTIDYASAMTDLAEQTQTNVEALQVLNSVARDAGAKQENLRLALSKVITTAQDAANGVTGYADAYKALGIDVDRFIRLPTERKMEAIGQAFVKAGESQAAYRAVARLLGEEAGPRMVEVLRRLGTDGFDAVADKARAAGEVISEINAQKLDRLADAFESFKTRALVAIGDTIIGFDNLLKKLSNTPRTIEAKIEADLDDKALRQALKELTAEQAFGTNRAGATIGTPVTAEQFALLRERTAAIRESLVAERELAAATQETTAAANRAKDEARERARVAQEVADAISEAEDQVARERLPLADQLAEVTAEMARQRAIAEDTTASEGARMDAAKEVAKLIREEGRLRDRIGEEAKRVADDAVERAKDLAARTMEILRERREFEVEQLSLTDQIADKEREVLRLRRDQSNPRLSEDRRLDAAALLITRERELLSLKKQQQSAQDAFRDVTRFSLNELASAERGSGIPRGVTQDARRVQKLERRAGEARTRGNDELADRLQNQAGELREKIPGLASSDRDLGTIAKDSLDKLKDIDKGIEDLTKKIATAKPGGE